MGRERRSVITATGFAAAATFHLNLEAGMALIFVMLMLCLSELLCVLDDKWDIS